MIHRDRSHIRPFPPYASHVNAYEIDIAPQTPVVLCSFLFLVPVVLEKPLHRQRGSGQGIGVSGFGREFDHCRLTTLDVNRGSISRNRTWRRRPDTAETAQG